MYPLAGVTAIDCNTNGLTVSVVDPDTAPEAALMVVLPGASVTIAPPAPIEATEGAELVQVTVAVRSCVAPLLKVPVATYWMVALAITENAAGVTASETN